MKEEQILTKPWQKFIDKTRKYQDVLVENWKYPEFIGYIQNRYLLIWGHEFALSFSKAPSSCTESFVIKKLSMQLNTSNPNKIKAYVDWMLDNKKIKFRSFTYFTTAGFINEYQNYLYKTSKITKSTPLPDEYKQVVNGMNVSCDTYGELAFIKLATDQNPIGREQYISLLKTLQNLGLNPESLKGL